MAGYRLYLMNNEGRIAQAVEFLCEDDDEALLRAQEECGGGLAELWSGARMIAKLPARAAA